MILNRQRNNKNKNHKLLRGVKLLSGALVLSLMLETAGSVQVYATQETQAALNQAKKEAKQTQEAVEAGQDTIDDLGETKSVLSDKLTDLNSQLSEISTNLAQLSSRISDKNQEIEDKQEEIDQTQDELDEAIAAQQKQYENMKKRIQFLYERGNVYYLEILLHSSSYSELLNRSTYIEQLNQYDQKTLEQYKKTAQEVKEKKEELEKEQEELQSEQEELESLHADVNDQANQVSSLVSDTASSLNSTNAQIDSVEDAVALLQDQLDAQNATVSALEKQLAEERRLQAVSDASTWRSLDSITFEEGDRTLLANLIYCEAGGESYEGQLAVGAVVMNRVMSGAFPSTVSGVIYQSNQFSPAMSGRLAVALANDEATASCYQAADAAMSGQTNVDNCLFFRTPIDQVTPKYRIGGHIFY
jgi:spore germination cell wall hydrolase CwlJ-like protein